METRTSTSGIFASMNSDQLRLFKYWQTRTIITTMIGYALFYFVRKNLSVAMPMLESDLGVSKSDLGLFLTLHGLIYGVSKFVNGFLGDRSNARIFMVSGLVLCAVANICFGFSSAILWLGVFWVINGWFQGMGYPPCARLMTHWIPPHQLATKMSIWNTSHSIGAGLAVIFCGYVVSMTWDAPSGLLGHGLVSIIAENGTIPSWRICFLLSAAVALIGAIGLWIAMRDTPSSVGLPEMQLGAKADIKENNAEFVRKHVFLNPVIWIISIGNFFVYTVRFAVLDWGPTLLKEYKHMDISHAGWSVAAFEVAGITGMLVAGWATDRFFAGRAPRTCVFCMGFAALFMLLFWQLNGVPLWVEIAMLVAAGFFIYGPQALVGIAAANIATKRAAATAGGFTGLFGYLSTIVSGWGLGLIAQSLGWSYAIGALIVIAISGMFTFALAWRYKPNGYEQ